MLTLRIKPKHLLSDILNVLEHIVIKRIAYKKSGDKSNADILKIVINSLYGKLGFEYSWLLDLKAMYQVTINGQLDLLMLIEAIEDIDGCTVISANTDGIVTKVKDNVIEEYKDICLKFSKYINIGGEFTEYLKYVRTTVNDYITIKLNGDVKTKGDFVSDIEIDKGYYAPAIAKTLYEYYVNDNHDIDSIINTFGIYDYCISVKVGRQFVSEFHTIKDGKLHIEELQGSNRYFVSKSGGVFLKRSIETDKHTNVIKGKYITVFNRYFESDNYNIDYNWYKSKVMTLINKVNNALTKDIRSASSNSSNKTSGTMFNSEYEKI